MKFTLTKIETVSLCMNDFRNKKASKMLALLFLYYY